MFERFTDRSRAVVVSSQNEAKALSHNYIGAEHLLLGLMNDPEAMSTRALDQLKVTLIPARERVEAIVGKGIGEVTGHQPFTPFAKRVLERALREALDLGHNYIGTEHILLALTNPNIVREGENVPVSQTVLELFDASSEKIRTTVLELLGQRGGDSV